LREDIVALVFAVQRFLSTGRQMVVKQNDRK
jgi:hypothetical protein